MQICLLPVFAKYKGAAALSSEVGVTLNEDLLRLFRWRVDDERAAAAVGLPQSASKRDVVVVTRHAWICLGATTSDQALLELSLGGAAPSEPIVIRAKDGSSMSIHLSVLEGDNDASREVLLLVRDVTSFVLPPTSVDDLISSDSARRNEQTLTEQLFRRMFTDTGIATAIVSSEGRFLSVNTAFCKLTRYSAEELARLKFTDLSRPVVDGVERNLDLFNATMRGELSQYEVDKRYVRKDGSTTWVRIRCAVIRAANGTPEAVLAQVEDIDARKMAEERLRASETLFREFAENLDGVAWLLDVEDRRALYVSSGFERIWGRPLAFAYSRPSAWTEAIVPEDRAHVTQAFEAFAAGSPERDTTTSSPTRSSAIHDEEFRIVSRSRVRWVRDRAAHVHGTSGNVYRIARFTEDITDRKLAEQALRRSEDQYRRLVSVVPDAVLMIQSGGLIMEANAAAARLVGVTRASELIARPFPDFFVSDDAQFAKELDELILHACTVEGVVKHVVRRRDACALALEISAAPVGEPVVATPTPFVSEAPRGIVGADNPRGNDNPHDDNNDDNSGVVAHRAHVTRLSKNEVSTGPLLLLIRDVTDRLRADAEIARQREELAAVVALREGDVRLRQIIDLVPHFVFAKDISGRFLLVNRAVAEAYGTTVRELEGKTDANFAKSLDEARRFRADDLDVLTSGQPKVIPEETITDAKGVVRILSTTKIPFSFAGSGTRAVLGVSIDITEQRLLSAQLVRAQKIEGLGRLAGGIAHDFNNLLSAIMSFAELLTEELVDRPELMRDAESIRDVALRASDLTRQLLAFSRQGGGVPRAVDASHLLRNLERLLEQVIGEDVRIEMNLSPESPHVVNIDPGRLEQVLVNLAINARDAMPRGGVLRIDCRNVTTSPTSQERLQREEEVGELLTEIEGAEPVGERWVELMMADTGTGMSQDVLARMFEPFFTTKEIGKGTGLGLATSYGIVKQAGGHLTVESTLGVGTTFRILLPKGDDDALNSPPSSTTMSANPSPRASQPDYKPPGATIVVIEDNPFVREATSRSLRRAGYTVLACATALDGLELLASPTYRGQLDLLISDIVMPVLNGFEVAAQATVLHPDLKVLFVSGYGADVLDRSSSGVRDAVRRARLLPKPFTPSQLLDEVRRTLGGNVASADPPQRVSDKPSTA